MKKQFAQNGIDLTEKQEQQFLQFLENFKDWNSKINLSAIREDSEIIEKNFIDSILPLKHFDFTDAEILDIGTGGGFPCIPLSIMTNAKFIALDSVQKKLKSIEDTAKKLGLNIFTRHVRAEELGQDKDFRESFDFVLTRAVAPWPVLLELSLPFVKIGGSFIAYQGPAIYEDLEKFKNLEERLGGKIINIFEEKLGDSVRVFVEIKKVKKTVKTYPRKPGEPKRNPLS